MVTVTNFIKRKNAKDEEFFTLELQGDVEMLRAVNSGKFYAHAVKIYHLFTIMGSKISELAQYTCKV